MTTTPKQDISQIQPDRMYSAREMFKFDVPFSYPVQLNRFLVADMAGENIFQTIMHKTSTKTRFFVRGELLLTRIPTLTREYTQQVIEKYENSIK